MGGGGGSNEIKETQAEKDHAKVVSEQWNDYQERFVPFENEYIEDVTGDPSLKEDIVSGRVNSDLAGQNNGAIPVGRINQIGSVIAGEDTSKAAATGASAIAAAKGSVRDTQVQGMLSAINTGRGQAAGAIEGMGTIAENASNQAASDAEAQFNRTAATQSAIGSGIGAGIAAGGEYLKSTKKAA